MFWAYKMSSVVAPERRRSDNVESTHMKYVFLLFPLAFIQWETRAANIFENNK